MPGLTLRALREPLQCSLAAASQAPAGEVVAHRATVVGPGCVLLGPVIARVTGSIVLGPDSTLRVRLRIDAAAARRYAAAERAGKPVEVVEQPDRLVGTAVLAPNRVVTLFVEPAIAEALRKSAG